MQFNVEGEAMEAKFEDMKSRTLTKIMGKVGDEEMRFIANDGGEFVLYYDED